MASLSMAASIPSGSWPLHSLHRILKMLKNQKLSKQTKQVVCNVYTQVRQPGLSVVSAFRMVSQLAGISECTVAQLKPEALRERGRDNILLAGRESEEEL